MRLLSTDITKSKRLSLDEVKLPAQKTKEITPLEPILKAEDVVIEKKPEPILKSLWDSLDSSSKSFWRAGGRGGEVGFTTFENNKKWK